MRAKVGSNWWMGSMSRVDKGWCNLLDTLRAQRPGYKFGGFSAVFGWWHVSIYTP